MAVMRMSFAAPITKVEFKDVGGQSLAEVSICKKNRAKEGQEPTFSWLRLAIWKAPAWMTAKLVKGAMIAGSGEFMLRSYTAKDGSKGVSAEVNCQSFDVEVSGAATEGEAAPAAAAPQRPVAAPVSASDEPPF